MKKIDKDRLDKVSRILHENPLKFPVATISRELGEPTSRVSTYINGTKPMPEKFYIAFMDEFGKDFKEDTIVTYQQPIENKTTNLDSLIRQNENLTKANMDLSANLLVLTRMLESKNGSDKENLVAVESMKHNFLELLSRLHTKGVKYQTNAEGISELNRLFVEIENSK